jgi:hypothetical protein
VVTGREGRVCDGHVDGPPDRKRDSVLGADLVEAELVAVGGLDVDPLRGDALAVDDDPVDTGETGVL